MSTLGERGLKEYWDREYAKQEMAGIPELTQHQRDLMAMGLCPFCERSIKNWKAVTGFCAPEWWATMDEHGVDGASGHLKSCTHKKVKL